MTHKQYLKKYLHYSFSKKDWRTSTLPLAFRWFNAAGSVLLSYNNSDPNYLGGICPGQADSFRKSLDEWWDITDHNSALKTMTDLLTNGMRVRLNRKMELFTIYRSQTIENGMVQANVGKPSNNDRLLFFWQKHGEKTFLGWDLCRACYIASWCHVCGYLSLYEMMDISVTAGQMLQDAFSDWNEVMESYIAGLFLWSDPHTPSENRDFQMRVHVYQTLKSRKGPYAAVPFRTPLSKTFTEEEKAKMHIIKGT